MSDYIERLDQRRQRREAAAADAAAADADSATTSAADRYMPNQETMRRMLLSSTASNTLGDCYGKRNASTATLRGVAASSHASAAASNNTGEGRKLAAAGYLSTPRDRRKQPQQHHQQQQQASYMQQQHAEGQQGDQHLALAEQQHQHLSVGGEEQHLSQTHVPSSEQEQKEKLAQGCIAAALELQQQAQLSEEKARCLPRGRQRELLLSFAAAKQQRAEELLQQQAAAAAERGGKRATCGQGEEGSRELHSQGGGISATTAAGVRSPHASRDDMGCSNLEKSYVIPVSGSSACSRIRPDTQSEETLIDFFSGGGSSSRLRDRHGEEDEAARGDRYVGGTDEKSKRMMLLQQQLLQLREEAAQQRDKAILVRGSKQRSLVLVAEKKEREAEQLLQKIHAYQQQTEEHRDVPSDRNGNEKNKLLQHTSFPTAFPADLIDHRPSQVAAAVASISPSAVPSFSMRGAKAADDRYAHQESSNNQRAGASPQEQVQKQEQQQREQQQRHLSLQQQWQQEIENHVEQQPHEGGMYGGEVAKLRMEAAVARDKASCCTGAKARQLRSLAEMKDRQAVERLKLICSPLLPPGHTDIPSGGTYSAHPSAALSNTRRKKTLDVAFRESGYEPLPTAVPAASCVFPAAVSALASVQHNRQEERRALPQNGHQVQKHTLDDAYDANTCQRNSNSSATHTGNGGRCYPLSDTTVQSSQRSAIAATATPGASAETAMIIPLNDERRLLLQRIALLREEADQNRSKASYLSAGRQRQLLAIAAAKERQALELEEQASLHNTVDSTTIMPQHPVASSSSHLSLHAARDTASSFSSSHPAACAMRAGVASASSSSSSLLQHGHPSPATQWRPCTLEEEQQKQYRDEEEETKKRERQRRQYEVVRQQQSHTNQQQHLLQEEETSPNDMGNRLLLAKQKEKKHMLVHAQLLPSSSAGLSMHPNKNQQQHLQAHSDLLLQQQEYRGPLAQENFLKQREHSRTVEERRYKEQQRTDDNIMPKKHASEEDGSWNCHNTSSSTVLQTSNSSSVDIINNTHTQQETNLSTWHNENGTVVGESRREILGHLQQRQHQLQQQLYKVEEQLMLQQQKHKREEGTTQRETALSRQLSEQKDGHHQQQQDAHQQLLQRQNIYNLRQQQAEEQQLSMRQHRRMQQQDIEDAQQLDRMQMKKQRQLPGREQLPPTQQQKQQEASLVGHRDARQKFTAPPTTSNNNSNSSSRGSLKSDILSFSQTSGRDEKTLDQQVAESSKSSLDITATCSNSRSMPSSGSNYRVGSRSSTATSLGLGSEF